MTATSAQAGPVRVAWSGGVSSEEIAAVLAALTRRDDRDKAATGYERWRDVRLAALRERPRRGSSGSERSMSAADG